MNRRYLRAWARLNRHAFAIAYVMAVSGLIAVIAVRYVETTPEPVEFAQCI